MTFKDLDKKATQGIKDAKEKGAEVKNKFDSKVAQGEQKLDQKKQQFNKQDEKIDQAGRDSFPASDSVSRQTKPNPIENGPRNI